MFAPLSTRSVKRSIGVLLTLGVLFPSVGCHEARVGMHELPADGEELEILRQTQGTHSHESRAMQLVIRDAATLARIPLVDVPVDFSKEMLLIVTLGRTPSDRFAVSIDRVYREGSRLRVETAVQYPPPNSPVAMAAPYCIAVIPKCDLNVANFNPEPPTRIRSWHQSTPPADW